MKISKRILVCVCLVGLTQFVWSQNQTIGAQGQGVSHPETFPAAAHYRVSHPGDVPLSGTPILFRENFVFTISAGDIPAAAVIFCYASMSTDDTNGEFYESNEVVATRSGSTATCTVPLLAKWTLVNPTTDMIDAEYETYAEQGFAIGGGGWDSTERSGDGPDLSLPVPANTQTVTNDISVTM
jgi:hypothetical protein